MNYYNLWDKTKPISDIVGLTFSSVEINANRDEIRFYGADGSEWLMYHSQDCCESVSVEDICGELEWLVGTPILTAEESTNSENHPDGSAPEFVDDSFTWTFYRIGTAKGMVVIRWYGSSNGYYSESVDLAQVTPPTELAASPAQAPALSSSESTATQSDSTNHLLLDREALIQTVIEHVGDSTKEEV